MKNSKCVIILITISIIIIIVSIYLSQSRYNFFKKIIGNQMATSTIETKYINPLDLNGKYLDEKSGVYASSEVKVSSSTDKSIFFQITTTNLAHGGYYEETAYRVASTSLVYVADKQTTDNNSLCIITLVFIDDSNLKYYVKDPDNLEEGSYGCRGNLGAHGAFMDGDIHKKNGTLTLPTIETLGFTKEDIKQFEKLIPGLLTQAQAFSNVATKLISKDIKNSTAYSIQTPNIYDTQDCDFSYPVGYCVFVVFMKDTDGHYWIMGGTTYDAMEEGVENFGFKYITNDPEWEDKLPDIFESELDRLGPKG